MIKFALNYSRPAAKLLRENKLKLDLFKCTDWDDMVAAAMQLLPCYVHFPLSVGRGNIGDIERAALFAERTETALINAHCAPLPEGDPFGRVSEDLAALTARFGAERLIIENYPYPLESLPIPRQAVAGEFLQGIIDATGCGLLLDLAHARLAARGLGLDPFEYISSLPVRHLRELHVVGVDESTQGELCDHCPMSDLDWQIFDWALSEIHAGNWRIPEIIACEYGGEGPLFREHSDPLVLQSQIPRMYQAVEEIRRYAVGAQA